MDHVFFEVDDIEQALRWYCTGQDVDVSYADAYRALLIGDNALISLALSGENAPARHLSGMGGFSAETGLAGAGMGIPAG